MTPRIALIGANGYGLHHRRAMAPLIGAGRIDLVGLCDLRPIRSEPGAPLPSRARVFTDYREMLSAIEPDVVVIASPPHSHLEIAVTAVRAGADVLVEKPPLVSMAEQRALTSALEETQRVCQVGFQALGSAALGTLGTAIRTGRLGRVTGIGTYGAWQRPDSYYERAPWAGRRAIDGRPVLDGALVNPFAHAVMQSLAVAEAFGPVFVTKVELERFRARPIEVDDTAVLRAHLTSRLPVVVAVTLCADEVVDPRVVVHSERGPAVLRYTTDELQMPGEQPQVVPGRAGLLDNLLDHRARPDDVPLLAPLKRTVPFTAVVDANTADGPPVSIAAQHLAVNGAGAERVVSVPGATALLRNAAEHLMLPSELGAPWAITAT